MMCDFARPRSSSPVWDVRESEPQLCDPAARPLTDGRAGRARKLGLPPATALDLAKAENGNLNFYAASFLETLTLSFLKSVRPSDRRVFSDCRRHSVHRETENFCLRNLLAISILVLTAFFESSPDTKPLTLRNFFGGLLKDPNSHRDTFGFSTDAKTARPNTAR